MTLTVEIPKIPIVTAAYLIRSNTQKERVGFGTIDFFSTGFQWMKTLPFIN